MLCYLITLCMSANSGRGTRGTCQRVTFDMCPAKEALFPNILGHEQASEAMLEISQFQPLIQIKCSPQLAPFLCGLYFPQCKDSIVPPCRSLCQGALRGCLPILEKFGYQWPLHLSCEQFPETGNCFLGGFSTSLKIMHRIKA